MFKKVVWATDGSESADQALPLAKTLVAEGDGEMLVVHCEELTLPGRGGGSFPVHANEDDLRVKIGAQVAELSGGGVPAILEMTRARVGGAAHAIAEAAESGRADVIVVRLRWSTGILQRVAAAGAVLFKSYYAVSRCVTLRNSATRR